MSCRELLSKRLRRYVDASGIIARERIRLQRTPDQAETEFISQIFRIPHFLNLVSEYERLQGRLVADPFVIACAQAREGYVVTQESSKPNAANFSNVCEHFGIRCTDYEGFLRMWVGSSNPAVR